MELYLENKVFLKSEKMLNFDELVAQIPFVQNDYFLLQNGRPLQDKTNLHGKIQLFVRVPGGKGGFGSMLRAIGAQIEKTTNREACRDLSGRRLRDINEEKRLKTWINAQVEREREAADQKQKKLERLVAEPKHEFRDADYDKLRSALPEKVEDAVIQGLQASCSSKRKRDDGKNVPQKKKPKLWIDENFSDSDSISEDDNNLNNNAEQIVEIISQ